MITDISKIDLKFLSETYDKNSRDTFVSVYLDMENFDEKFMKDRINACLISFDDEIVKENFIKTVEWIKDFIKEREYDEKGIIIFASYVNNFFETYRLNIPVKNLLVVDSSPYIRPIAEMMDEYKEYNLVILNNNRARIYRVVGDKVIHEKHVSEHVINKHKKGGWSQARFQRIRKEEIKKFLKKVAEDMEKIGMDEFIIAGPGEAKKWLIDMLPERLKKHVVATIDIDFEAKGLEKMADKIIENREKLSEEEIVKNFKEELLKDGLAVCGLRNTIKALINGMVDMVIINEGLKIRGWKCERCQIFDVGIARECPICGSETTVVDVIEEMVESAQKTDAGIVFVSQKLCDGAGAFLRWKS